jgi:hypothetical protein
VAATWSALLTKDGANQSSPLAMPSCTEYGIWPANSLSSLKGPRLLNPHDLSWVTVADSHAAVLGYWF